MLKLTINAKLMLIVICTVALVIFSVIAMSTKLGLNQLSVSSQNYEQRIAGLLTKQNAGNIKFNKEKILVETFEGFAADETIDFAFASAVRLDGASIAEKTISGELSAPASELARSAIESQETKIIQIGDVELIAIPARFGKKQTIVGAFVMGWDQSPSISEAYDSAITTTLTALAIAAAAMVGLYLGISYIVTNPLRLLTSTPVFTSSLEVEIRLFISLAALAER